MLERLLIVGLGSIGARHARLVRELSWCADYRVEASKLPGYE